MICRNRPVNFCEELPTRFAVEEEMPSPKGCCSKPATGMANALATMEKPTNNRKGIMDAGGWHRQSTPRRCGRHVCYKLMSVNMNRKKKKKKEKTLTRHPCSANQRRHWYFSQRGYTNFPPNQRPVWITSFDLEFWDRAKSRIILTPRDPGKKKNSRVLMFNGSTDQCPVSRDPQPSPDAEPQIRELSNGAS